VVPGPAMDVSYSPEEIAFQRQVRGLLSYYSTGSNVIIQIGVVDGLAIEVSFLEPVNPAVSNMCDGRLASVDVNQCDGRCHRFISRIAFGKLEDVTVRELDRSSDQLD